MSVLVESVQENFCNIEKEVGVRISRTEILYNLSETTNALRHSEVFCNNRGIRMVGDEFIKWECLFLNWVLPLSWEEYTTRTLYYPITYSSCLVLSKCELPMINLIKRTSFVECGLMIALTRIWEVAIVGSIAIQTLSMEIKFSVKLFT